MRFEHTNRKGFWLGFIDFFTAGLFFLFYMPFGGLQRELEAVLGHKVQPYWQAYLVIPVRGKRLSGVLEIICPDRGNHHSGDDVCGGASIPERILPGMESPMTVLRFYSLSSGSSPYTSLMER